MVKIESFLKSLPPKNEYEKHEAELRKSEKSTLHEIEILNGRIEKASERLTKIEESLQNLYGKRNEFYSTDEGVVKFNKKYRDIQIEKEDCAREIEGLNVLMGNRKSEVAAIQKELANKEYALSLYDLYSLFDQYNKQAAELAETMEKMLHAQNHCGEIARNGTIDDPKHNSVIFYMGKGVPMEIPAILLSESGISLDQKFHWNWDYAKSAFAQNQ